MANLVSPFTIEPLGSATGFHSPGFTVSAAGSLTLTNNLTVTNGDLVIQSGAIRNNNTIILTSNSLGAGITTSSLTSVGTLSALTVNGGVSLSGAINITSTPTTGSINNVSIGMTTPSVGKFTNLYITNTLNLHPTITGALNNTAIGVIEPAAGNFTNLSAADVDADNIIASSVQIDGSLSVQGTNLKTLAIAMSIALS